MPSVNNETPLPIEHSFSFPEEPLDDDVFSDILVDAGGFDDDGNWEEGTGEIISDSNAESTSPYAHLSRKFGEEAIGAFTEYAITGISPSDVTNPGEGEQYSDWLSSIDDVTRINIKALGRFRDTHEKVRVKIIESSPYLLEGKLSPEQEDALQAKHYTLGFNQSGTFTLEDAEEYLGDNNGIETTTYGLDQRFILLNEQNKDEHGVIERAVVDGYYGNSKIGRFVIAIPTNTPESNPISAADSIADFQRAQDGKRSVNPKYIAGYIDSTGEYHQNLNFALSGDIAFKSAEDTQAVEPV